MSSFPEQSPIDRIPPEILKFTFSFLPDDGYNKVLRYICRRWKSLISSGEFDPDDFLDYSAFNGYENLCRLSKDWGAIEFASMLYWAARGGHKDLCRLAKEWGAAELGDWGCNLMLHGAAEGGHEDLCRLAKDWGANNFDFMLRAATKGGHENLCRLAKEWSDLSGTPLDFNKMLFAAGRVDLCVLAKDWGATDFTRMLTFAPNDAIRNLAQQWIEESQVPIPCRLTPIASFVSRLMNVKWY